VSSDNDAVPSCDPEIAAAIAELPISIGDLLGALSDENLAATRELMGLMPPPELSDAVDRTDYRINENVIVRVHRPADVSGDLPCLFWIHGGGMVLGNYTQEDARFDKWCPELGCVGVAIEHRLAPETKYPGPLEDCYDGLKWVYDHADELHVDVSRIGIGGNSAGGGLAAALALLARDRGEISIKFQALIYPMIDDRQTTISSTWNDPVWPPSANTYGWRAYLGDEKGSPDLSGYAAAARATDLAGLPPTLISVGAIDGFSDEDIDYAVRLRHAGVPVELYVYAGAPHGFDSLAPGTSVARRANRNAQEWLRKQLG
jgi:acetyl esterase/lipase